MIFDCPRSAAMPSLPLADACQFKFDQIIGAAFQRAQPLATPSFTTAAPITELDSWVALMAAVGATKIVVSPTFAGLVIPPSEATETGGNDNTTKFGIPEYGGEGAVKVDYIYTGLSPLMIAGIRKFSQESIPLLGTYALTVYLFTKDGAIIYNKRKGAAVGSADGLPIYNYRLSSIGSEGLNAGNKNNAGFYLPPYWDETVAMVTPTDWNPLIDLVAAA